MRDDRRGVGAAAGRLGRHSTSGDVGDVPGMLETAELAVKFHASDDEAGGG